MRPLFLGALAGSFLLLGSSGLQARELTGGVPVTSNLSITGGICHEAPQNGLPAYADVWLGQGMETPGLQEEVTYSSGFAYRYREDAGVFLDINRTYRGAPAFGHPAQAGKSGTRLRPQGGKINLGFFTGFMRRARFFVDFGYSFAEQRLVDDRGETPRVPRATGSVGLRLPLTPRSQFNLVGSLLSGAGDQGAGLPLSRVSIDTVVAVRGPAGFAAVFGVSNILDQRFGDNLRKTNGLHCNPGRNFFLSFKKQF